MRYIGPSIALLSILISGCVGAFVPVQTVESTGILTVETAARIAVVPQENLRNRQNVGEVVGHSCKNKLWDPDATTEAALFQTKLAAAQRGASTISNLDCSEGSVSLATNCWQSYVCKATAYR